MHRPDSETFKAFYQSPIGSMTCLRLAGHIRQLWPSAANDTIAGIGYALPYLQDNALGSAIALLPGWVGAQARPGNNGNRACLSPDSMLPLREGILNRALVIHGLEFSEKPHVLLQEIWRTLVPKGRILIIVPNRLGLWARLDKTPFGFGTPYSLAQLENLLKQTRFHVLHAGSALFMPPTDSHVVLHASTLWCRISRWCLKNMGGVLIVEAEKRLYAEVPEVTKETVATMQPMAVTSLNRDIVKSLRFNGLTI